MSGRVPKCQSEIEKFFESGEKMEEVGEAESSAAIKARVTAPWYVLPALTICDLPERVSFNVQ